LLRFRPLYIGEDPPIHSRQRLLLFYLEANLNS
jgi:hypothetical protein